MAAVRDLIPGVISNDAVWSSSVAVLVDNAGATLGGVWSTETPITSYWQETYGANFRFNANGTGTDTAMWPFTGLTASAPYKVAMGWGSGGAAVNTPWSIHDSADGTGTVLASGTVNQNNQPTGILGTVTPSGTVLSLKITDNATGGGGGVICDVAAVADGDGTIPGNGDTATLYYSHTVDQNWTIGASSEATPAITFGNTSNGTGNGASVSAASLTISAGITLTAKGDIATNNLHTTSVQVITVDAGATLSILPASGHTYDITSSGDWALDVTGSSGSHATIKCDLSSGGSMGSITIANNISAGLRNATYGDFIDISVNSGAKEGGTVDRTQTHLTITRGNYQFSDANSWDGDFRFEDVTFEDSVTFNDGSFDCVAGFSFNTASPTGLRRIKRIGFDGHVSMQIAKQPEITDCYIGGNINMGTPGTTTLWTSNDQYNGNLSYGDFGAGGTQIAGPIRDCYFANTTAANPHTLTGAEGHEVLRVIFDCPGPNGGAAGDMLFGGNPTRCVVVMSGNDDGMKLTGPATALHDTVFAKDAEFGMMHLNEASATTDPGDVPAVNDCFVWSDVANTSVKAIVSSEPDDHAEDTVTETLNCAFWNGSTGTIEINGTPTASLGYDGIKVSTAGQVSGQVTINSDVMVEKERNMALWGATLHATNGTAAAAAELCRLDPTLILAVGDESLVSWTFAGINVTGAEAEAEMLDAGDDGDTIGAGEFVDGVGFTASPSTIPKNHAGNITLTLTGDGTAWDNTTVFSLSGVSGVTKISQSVASATSATITLTTGSSTGTLTITESVTGDSTETVTVATATLTITPTTALLGTTPTLTLVGANTVWEQETPATLFSISGGENASLGTPTITTDEDGTMVLTGGAGTGTLTITDNSTGATDTVAIGTATAYTVSPAGTVRAVLDHAKTFIFQANGLATEEVTPATDGDGDWSPATVTLDDTNAVTATYTPNDFADSPHTLSFTDDGTLNDPANIIVNVSEHGGLSYVRMRHLLRP